MSEEKFDTSPAAGTGSGPTIMVAIEQNFPTEQRLIDDDLALKILPGSYQFLVKLMRIPFL
jgi:O-methyltransferase involved in polyketide biosynthesis